MFLSKARLMLFGRMLAYGGVGAILGLVVGFVVALIAATVLWMVQGAAASGLPFRSFFPSFAAVGFIFGPIVFSIFGAIVGLREEYHDDECCDMEVALAEAAAEENPEVVVVQS